MKRALGPHEIHRKDWLAQQKELGVDRPMCDPAAWADWRAAYAAHVQIPERAAILDSQSSNSKVEAKRNRLVAAEEKRALASCPAEPTTAIVALENVPAYYPSAMLVAVSQVKDSTSVTQVVDAIQPAGEFPLATTSLKTQAGRSARAIKEEWRNGCVAVTTSVEDKFPAEVKTSRACGSMCQHDAPSQTQYLLYLKLCRQFELLAERFGIGVKMANADVYILLEIDDDGPEPKTTLFLNLRLASGRYGVFRAAQTFHVTLVVVSSWLSLSSSSSASSVSSSSSSSSMSRDRHRIHSHCHSLSRTSRWSSNRSCRRLRNHPDR